MDFDDAAREFQQMSRRVGDGAAMYRDIGKRLVRIARQYAPKAPTRAMLNRMRKTRGPTRRKARATSGPKPGGLERSIGFSAGRDYVDILVPANSEAGAYAAIIHDQKGSKWHNRGPGTVQKGPKADEKFIDRAIEDERDAIDRIARRHVDRAMRG